MTRCDYCKIRENVQKLKEMCEKGSSTWYEIEQIADFCHEHKDSRITNLSGGALLPLIREPHDDVRGEVISNIEKALSHERPLIRRFKHKITAKDVNASLKKIKKEKGLLEEDVSDKTQKTVIDTELEIKCPICGETLHLYHNDPQGTHTLKNTNEQDHAGAIRVTSEEIDILNKTAEELGITPSALVHSMVKKQMEKQNG